MTVITGKKVLAVITGASRGIGRQIALSLASDVAGGSAFLLMARNAVLLEKVKGEILELNPETIIATFICDFSTDKPVSKIDEIFHSITDNQQFETKLIFHNAGTIGDLSKSSNKLNDNCDWIKYLQTNFISMVTLNNHLCLMMDKHDDIPIFVINITSLAAVLPMASMTQYCVGKAAREAFFRNFAVENKNVRVLSYSPGPVETDMILEVYEKTYDDDIKEKFAPNAESSEVQRKRLTPKETVSKLIGIVDKNEFENGTRIDYFD